MGKFKQRAISQNISAVMLLAFAAGDVLSAEGGGIEEVIVTAQKRAESVQDVPIAINALSGDQLDKLGVRGSDDLTTLYPNLSLKATNSINSGFSIRGVGTNNFHATAQQAVGQYADEVSLLSPYASQFALFDMERVEVLRGPQNTLFGRNTTGGAVNFISKKPDVEAGLNGFGRIKVGNEGTEEFEGAIGVPLGETLAARIAVQTVNRDGVWKNLLDNKDTGRIEKHAGRLQLLWQPSDASQLLVNYHAGYNRSDMSPTKLVGNWQTGSPNIGTVGNRGPADCPLLGSNSTSRFDGPNNCVTAINNMVFNPSTNDWNDVYQPTSATGDIDFEGAFVKFTHDFDNFALTSITSYDTVDVIMTSDVNGGPIAGFHPGQDAEYESWSQEIRLASTTDGSFRWIVGGYYSREDDTLSTIIRRGDDGTPPFTVVPSVAIEQDVDIYSLYGQLEYDLTEKLTMTFGLRYTKDEKDGTSTARVLAGTLTGRPGPRAPDDFLYTLSFLEQVAPVPEYVGQNGEPGYNGPSPGICPPPVGGLPCVLGPTPVEQTLEEFGGKLGLDYQLSDDILLYGSYSRGFKSGAFDTRALAAFQGNADRPADPEFLDAWEVGVKSTLLDGTLELNGAVFLYYWDDLQVFDTDENGATAFLNIPEVELQGAEIEVKWAPGAGWYLQGGVGVIDTEITNIGTLSNAQKGAKINGAPELSYSGLIAKEIELDSGVLTLQTNFSWTDEYQEGLKEEVFTRLESVLFVDARVAYQFGDEEQYEVALWGKNLTEEKTCLGGTEDNATLSNGVNCRPNPGMAFYGISLSAEF